MLRHALPHSWRFCEAEHGSSSEGPGRTSRCGSRHVGEAPRSLAPLCCRAQPCSLGAAVGQSKSWEKPASEQRGLGVWVRVSVSSWSTSSLPISTLTYERSVLRTVLDSPVLYASHAAARGLAQTHQLNKLHLQKHRAEGETAQRAWGLRFSPFAGRSRHQDC